MKTKNILLFVLLALLAVLSSCKKDHDIPKEKVFNASSGGGTTTDSLTISVYVNPSEGGFVTGGGKYQKGKTCVVVASANEGYVFSNWTENGTQVSTSVSYSFTVDTDRTLVANFSVSSGNNFTITAISSPEFGGIVNGSGTYQQGQTCTVTAIANEGYSFTNWTVNGTQVSANAIYTFTVMDNRTIVANFITNDAPTPNDPDYSHLVLNELNGNDKFIEIFNAGSETVNLSGVYIEKDSVQNWLADNTVSVDPGGYLVLWSEDVAIDHPDVPEAFIFHSALSAKKNVRIQLFTPSGVSIGDFNLVDINQNAPAYIPAPASYSRNANGNWYYADATPGALNIDGTMPVLGLEGGDTPEPPTPEDPDYTKLFLNELNGDTKFIELYNKGDADLSIEGSYILKDDYAAGAIWTADAAIVVPAHGYVLLYSEDVTADHPNYPENLFFHSGISSRKTCRYTLFLPDGTVCDEFVRGNTGEWGQTISTVAPQSYARTPDGGDWKLADPTPGEANPAIGGDIPQE